MKNFFKKLMSSKSQSKYFSETVQRIGKNNAGFSLVELIVVIAIMAILAAVAVIGVSVYIPKAQKAADQQLAADIEKTMNMYAQAGDLTPGDYVVIYFDKDAVCGNSKDNTATTMETLMKGMYGDNWQKELRLSWDGWEAGPASDASVMENIENSNFKRDEMGQLLDQVQSVVDAFSGYMVGNEVQSGSATQKYLQMAGINDVLVTEENKYAVGNAAVFGVAESISNGLADDTVKEEYIEFWKAGGGFADGEEVGEALDVLSSTAANYACALAWAKYADSQTGGDKYTSMLTNGVGEDGEKQDELINTNMASVIEAIVSDNSFNYEAYYEEIVGSTGKTQAEIDAMAFLSYMDGITSSSGSILEGNDVSKKDFFTDGNVLNYVDNYFNASDYLQNAPDGAMVFIYDGSSNIFSVPGWADN